MDDRAWMEVASAKVRVGEAAGAGAAIAHQLHGAIGFTAEHALQRYTRRLWSWRDDFGAESHWAEELGRAVAAAGRGRPVADAYNAGGARGVTVPPALRPRAPAARGGGAAARGARLSRSRDGGGDDRRRARVLRPRVQAAASARAAGSA